MQFNLDTTGNEYSIQAYEPGKIKINHQWYTQSIIVTPHQVIENWEPQTLEELTPESFNSIIELKPNIILIGSGTESHFPKASLIAPLLSQNIGVEVMNTGAACRTFNVLLSEGRNVIAILFLTR